MALGKLGSLVTTNANPVGIFTATESQTVTVYVNNQTNSNARYSIGVSTSASTIQSDEYLRKNNYLAPLEVVEVEKLYIDPNQTLVAQSSIAGVSFAAIAVGSGETTGYGKSDSVLITDATKGTNVVVSTASTDLVYTIGINNQGYDDSKIYVGVADSAGDLDNGWIIFAQTLSPGANFSINDLYVAEQQQIVVKSSVKDISFTTLSNIPSVSSGSGNVVGINTLAISYFNGIDATGVITATGFVGDLTGDVTGNVSGDVNGGTLVGSALSISGIVTSTNLNVSGVSTLGLTTVTTESLLTNAVKVSGAVTASSFVGDGSGLTGVVGSGSGIIVLDSGVPVGTAGTVNFGQGLSVSPVSGAAVTVTAPEGLFSNDSSGISTTGDLSVGGLTVSGVSTLTGRTNLQGVSEGLERVNGNIVNLTWSETGSNVGYCTLVNGPVFLKVNGIPTDSSFDNKVITFSVVINQGNIARACQSVTLNGVTFSGSAIRWAGGTIALGNTSCYDIFTFIGINTVGSASSTANYEILGSVNGDFRTY